MTSWICVDSGILIKVVVPEADSHLASQLWASWLQQAVKPVAPPLFSYEVTAVIRKAVYQNRVNTEMARIALKSALAVKVTLLTFPHIHEEAWELATALNRPTAYDTHYLALAKHLNCPFWTADRPLYHAAQTHFSWVHWLGELESASPLD